MGYWSGLDYALDPRMDDPDVLMDAHLHFLGVKFQ